MTEHDIELAKQAGAIIHDMSLAHESIRKNSYLFPTDFHLNQFIELIRAEKQGEYEAMKKDAERWIFVNSENYYVVCRYNDSPYGASYEPVEVESIDKAME
jgi:hypothetical protein